jgi:hypothetical protein
MVGRTHQVFMEKVVRTFGISEVDFSNKTNEKKAKVRSV